MKIDNTGNLFNVFDGPNSNYYNASHSICELPNGNFVSIGQYHMLNNPVRYDWEICHFDSRNINFNKTIGFTNGDEFGKDIISIGNNEFLIGGFTQTSQWGKDMAIFHGDDTGNELILSILIAQIINAVSLNHFTLVMKKIAHLNLPILKSSKQIKTLIFYGLIRMAQHFQKNVLMQI